MKRNFFKYLFCTLAAILTLTSLTGCKDDVNDNDNSNVLEGTIWMRESSKDESYCNVRCYYEIMYFTKNKVGIYPLDKDKKIIGRRFHKDYKLEKGKLYIGNSLALNWTDEYIHFNDDYYRVYPPFIYFLP